jgi:hypothetical protein
MFVHPASRYATPLMSKLTSFLMDFGRLKAHHTEDRTLRALNHFERSVVNIVLCWDERVEEAELMTAAEARMLAEKDVKTLLDNARSAVQTTADQGRLHKGLRQLLEHLFDRSLHAPMGMALLAAEQDEEAPYSVYGGVGTGWHLDVYQQPKLERVGLFLSDLGTLGRTDDVPLTWPTLGTRLAGTLLEPNKTDPGGLPLWGLALGVCLQNKCWGMADELWATTPTPPHKATAALHALIGGMAGFARESDVDRESHFDQMIKWTQRLLAAGANPEHRFLYTAEAPFHFGDYCDRTKRGEPATGGTLEVKETGDGRAMVSASDLVVAYTNKVIVLMGAGSIDGHIGDSGDDDEELEHEKALIKLVEPWVDIWSRQWQRTLPQGSAFGLNKQSLPTLLFDTFLECRDDDETILGIRRAIERTTAGWGPILIRQEWIKPTATSEDPTGAAGFIELSHAMGREDMLAFYLAGPLNRMQNNDLDRGVLTTFDALRANRENPWPAVLLLNVAGVMARRMPRQQFLVRSDQLTAMERMAGRLPVDERAAAMQYVREFSEAAAKGREEIDQANQRKANQKEQNSVGQSALERVLLAAGSGFGSGPEPDIVRDRPAKRRI